VRQFMSAQQAAIAEALSPSIIALASDLRTLVAEVKQEVPCAPPEGTAADLVAEYVAQRTQQLEALAAVAVGGVLRETLQLGLAVRIGEEAEKFVRSMTAAFLGEKLYAEFNRTTQPGAFTGNGDGATAC
jgi:hypothetical protein